MRKYLLPSLIILSFLSLRLETTFSQTVNLRVVFPSNIAVDRLSISYDNGKEKKNIKPIIENNEWTLRDSLYDPYSQIIFYYDVPKTMTVKGYPFWLSDKPTEIIFHGDSLSSDDPLACYTSRNVIIPKDDAYKDSISRDIDQRWIDLDNYYRKNSREFNVNPLKADTFEYKRNTIVKKELERIRIRPKDYFALDLFNTSIVRTRSALTPPMNSWLSLMKIFPIV